MLADARVLVERLDTGDRMDPVIGDRMFKTKSSEELYHLNLLVEWAKAARLLRVAGGRLLPVKKNARLLDRPDELWNALFEAVPRIGSAVLVSGWLESVFSQEYDAGLRALLHRLYAVGGPVGGETLRTAVWQAVTAPYILDDVPAERLRGWRGSNDRDVRLLLDALTALGAVRRDDDTAELTGPGRRAVAVMRGEPRPGDPVFQLRIDLDDVAAPAVWRRVQVPATARLDQVHAVIQAAMGWENSHMHAFTADGVQYGRPVSELGFRDERAVTLGALLKEGGTLAYTYDFGDSWEHRVTLERRLAAEADRSYPVCVAGSGACPPEDCGGSWAYEDLKRALADPSHAEHADTVRWLGLDSGAVFDPARFTPGEANERLRLASGDAS
ncbi:plasmid pRiA4b ORF-3 family protein [Streptomyces sp. ISL-87]|nr:plasmid pRiA4b ORF-3 family protein [Streptomyces sp. ISL-21]MBT2612537.1 plasmid pRiA4b ORF-3 family protein [Streptomyces sp. ISL-87]